MEKRSPVSMELEWRSPWGQRPPPPWGTRGTQVRPLCPWEEAKGEDILGFPAPLLPSILLLTFYAYSSMRGEETLRMVTGQDASLSTLSSTPGVQSKNSSA